MPTKRLRHYGLSVGEMEPGALNHICDVPGVSIGHVTLHSVSEKGVDGAVSQDSTTTTLPEGVCTGVTAILPHDGDWFQDKCAAAAEIVNGFGKTTGLVQLRELGQLESPIMLTNTFSVPAVTEGALRFILCDNPGIGDGLGSLNVIVGECNDSYLNDMRGLHVSPHHSMAAIGAARQQTSLLEGAVGGGTGMMCFGWKGGIGSASRKLVVDGKTYHIGVLVQSNYGRSADLTILGAPVGRYFKPTPVPPGFEYSGSTNEPGSGTGGGPRPLDGSIMMVVGTDLPVDAHQLKRMARRCVVGLARTGSVVHNGSGDVVIAFSNGTRVSHTEHRGTELRPVMYLSGALMSDAFRAVVEATEEAVLNSLFAATTTVGRDKRMVPGLPVEDVAAFVKQWTRAAF